MIWLNLLQFIFIPLVSPLTIGVIKKMKARFQNREGASILQPYRNIWKLLHKDEVITTDASWIFRFAPFIMFTVTLVVGASIPLFSSLITNSYTSDLLVIIYVLSIGTFFLALAGMDSGGGFGGFGSSREMTVAAIAEGGLIFSLLTVALVHGTTNLITIASNTSPDSITYTLPLSLALIGFFIVLLAETARFPFDNPATHLELTMIHEAMILEHSGKKLALIEWTAANKLLIFMAIGFNVFFPWGLATSIGLSALALAVGIFLLKMIAFCLVIALIESSIAKLRFFRLPDLLIISFILNCIAIGLLHYL
jgi:formate hydrogenlyase subunit 4